jgi:hypothetical protein
MRTSDGVGIGVYRKIPASTGHGTVVHGDEHVPTSERDTQRRSTDNREGFPTLIVIDPEGTVRDVHVGYLPTLQTELTKMIEGLLRRK